MVIPNGWSLRESRVINLEILVLISLSVCVFNVNKPLGVLMGYSSLTFPFHQAIDTDVMFAMMSYAVLYLLIVNRKWDVEWFWNTICMAAIINVLWQISQYFGLWVWTTPAPFFIGLLSNPNETSAFLAVCLPCFFRRGWKWLIPIPLIGLYLGVSIGGIMAAAIAGLVYLFLHHKDIGMKRLLTLFVALTLMLSIFIVHKNPSIEGQMNNRGRYWKEMIPTVVQKPFGWGWGQFKFVQPLLTQYYLLSPQSRMMLHEKVGDKEGFEKAARHTMNNEKHWREVWIEAHSEYLEVAFALGLVGLTLLLVAIGSTLLTGGNTIAQYGFLISCISAVWFFSFQIVTISIVTISYLGVLHHENT